MLSRTLENFLRPGSRDLDGMRNGDGSSDGSDDEGRTKTPRDDKMDMDEANGLGRSTRCTSLAMVKEHYTNGISSSAPTSSTRPISARSHEARDPSLERKRQFASAGYHQRRIWHERRCHDDCQLRAAYCSTIHDETSHHTREQPRILPNAAAQEHCE